jgi:hypothetical protein
MNSYRALLLAMVLSPAFAFADISCPTMPAATTDVNHDVKSHVDAAVGTLGKLKGGELSVQTEVEARNLMKDLPNGDRVLIAEMMAATYCGMLRDNKAVAEKDKPGMWARFQRETYSFVLGNEQSGEQKGDPPPRSQVPPSGTRPPHDTSRGPSSQPTEPPTTHSSTRSGRIADAAHNSDMEAYYKTPMSLRDLYDSDFPGPTFWGAFTFNFGKSDTPVDCRAFLGNVGETKSLRFFIPKSPDVTAIVAQILIYTTTTVEQINTAIKLSATMSQDPIGAMKLASASFSGRVYIYYENETDQQEMDRWQDVSIRHSVVAEFRGTGYRKNHENENRLLIKRPRLLIPANSPLTVQPDKSASSGPATANESLPEDPLKDCPLGYGVCVVGPVKNLTVTGVRAYGFDKGCLKVSGGEGNSLNDIECHAGQTSAPNPTVAP